MEMQETFSTYTCAAKTLARNMKMLSSIEISYLMEMQETLSADNCAVKTLAWHHTSANMLIMGKRDVG